MNRTILTNTAMATFRACPRKYRNRYVYRLAPARQATALRFGSAFHLGLEIRGRDVPLLDPIGEATDHLLFIGYDLAVKDGKGDQRTGSSRTIYPVERPHCMAKSRTISLPEALTKNDASFWTKLFA